MPVQPISLNEASWRLEKSSISGRVFAELLLKSPPILLGIHLGYHLPDRIDLSRVTSFRAEAENVLVADGVRWTKIKLDWAQLVAAFKSRGCTISWTWFSDITPELLERSRQPYFREPIFGQLATENAEATSAGAASPAGLV